MQYVTTIAENSGVYSQPFCIHNEVWSCLFGVSITLRLSESPHLPPLLIHWSLQRLSLFPPLSPFLCYSVHFPYLSAKSKLYTSFKGQSHLISLLAQPTLILLPLNSSAISHLHMCETTIRTSTGICTWVMKGSLHIFYPYYPFMVLRTGQATNVSWQL